MKNVVAVHKGERWNGSQNKCEMGEVGRCMRYM